MSNSESKPLKIDVSPRTFAMVLGTAIVFLVTLGTVSKLVVLHVGADVPNGIREISTRFDLDGENTLPSWFSSMQLFLAASLLALISRSVWQAKQRYFWHWVVLSGCFFYLSLDESAVLHEISMVPLRRWLGASGILYFTWVVPGAVLVLAFGVAYLRFLLALPSRTRNLLIVAGVTFVGGALGCELIGGAVADFHGFENLVYVTVMTIEESLEMVGILIFVCGLLDYLARQIGDLHATFQPLTLPRPSLQGLHQPTINSHVP